MGLEVIVLMLAVWFVCKVFGGSRQNWTDAQEGARRAAAADARNEGIRGIDLRRR
jgi:hypothetical protein